MKALTVVSTVCFALVAFAAGPAAAQDDAAEARRRWKRGQDLYTQGKFIDAAKEFEAGYAAAPRNHKFLLNIGLAYRKAQDLVKAKAAYQSLLRLQPDFPQRAEVEGYLKSIDDALTAGEVTSEPARPPPPPSPAPALPTFPAAPEPAPPSLSAPAPEPPSIMDSAPPADEPTPARGSGSLFRKPLFWVIVGAVVAGGVAAAVIVTRPSSSCPGTLCIKE